MITKIRLLLLLWALFVPLLNAQKKLALVVGIAGYPNFPDDEKLKFAGRDADEFTAFIRTPQGGSFQSVHVVTNGHATREKLYDEFSWLYESAGPNDTVYVFFAGHGTEYRNVLYFLPYNASRDHPDALGIPMNEFLRKVTSDLAAKQVVVFIDACHAAGAAEGARAPLSIDIQKQWNALNDKEGQVSMALFSSLAYQKSWEDPDLGGGHGLFTWYLLEGLKGGAQTTAKGLISADNIWAYVKEKVEARSRDRFPELQTPSASSRFRTNYVLAYAVSPTVSLTKPTPFQPQACHQGCTKCALERGKLLCLECTVRAADLKELVLNPNVQANEHGRTPGMTTGFNVSCLDMPRDKTILVKAVGPVFPAFPTQGGAHAGDAGGAVDWWTRLDLDVDFGSGFREGAVQLDQSGIKTPKFDLNLQASGLKEKQDGPVRARLFLYFVQVWPDTKGNLTLDNDFSVTFAVQP